MVKQKFAVGDIVCAADSGQIYPAKVLKAQSDAEEKVWKYFIHFQKWDSKYDTWIDEHRLCGMKDEAGKKKLLEKIMLMAPDAGGPKETKKRGKGASRASDSATMEPGSEFNDSNSAEGPKSKKKLLGLSSEELAASRKRHKALLQADVLDERDSDFPTKLQIPVSLKKHLVDEWGLITKDPKRLLKLPRQMPVAKLLKDFLEHRAKKLEPDEFADYKNVCDSVQTYFDKALPTILLYRQERAQYDQLAQSLEGVPASLIYGTEHLLRLFVRLPRMLASVLVPHTEMVSLEAKLLDLLKFIQKNSDTYVTISDYALVDEAMAMAANCKESVTADTLLHVANVDEVKYEEPVKFSPATGRPMRRNAGKNDKFDDSN